MTRILFSSPKLGIFIEGQDDLVIVSGRFDGIVIKSAIPISDGARCVLLLDPDASSAPVFKNLLCIDRAGDVIWRAQLRAIPDVFVSVAQNENGVLAKTWSGTTVLLDETSGLELKTTFNK